MRSGAFFSSPHHGDMLAFCGETGMEKTRMAAKSRVPAEAVGVYFLASTDPRDRNHSSAFISPLPPSASLPSLAPSVSQCPLSKKWNLRHWPWLALISVAANTSPSLFPRHVPTSTSSFPTASINLSLHHKHIRFSLPSPSSTFAVLVHTFYLLCPFANIIKLN